MEHEIFKPNLESMDTPKKSLDSENKEKVSKIIKEILTLQELMQSENLLVERAAEKLGELKKAINSQKTGDESEQELIKKYEGKIQSKAERNNQLNNQIHQLRQELSNLIPDLTNNDLDELISENNHFQLPTQKE